MKRLVAIVTFMLFIGGTSPKEPFKTEQKEIDPDVQFNLKLKEVAETSAHLEASTSKLKNLNR